MIAFEAQFARGTFTLDVSFTTKARVAALFGPSGAGKSTVIDVLAGLVKPDRGRIAVDGEVLLDTTRGILVPAHRRRIAVVFQDAQLFPHLSVRQNLGFGRWFTPRSQRRVDIAPVIDTLGIGHLMDRRPRTLSGGERQRVALARALLASPRLLLMDEPFASLDMRRRFEALRLVERLRDATGIPICYVSHSTDEILQIADDVIAIEGGRVVAQGVPAHAFAAAAHLVEDRRFGLASPLACIVGSYDGDRDTSQLVHPAGTIVLVGEGGRPGDAVRLQVRATDVALALAPLTGLSIRTMLAGKVERIDLQTGALAVASVRLRGGDLLLASVTRLACDELALVEGMDVYCLVKSAALDERNLRSDQA